MLLAAWILTFFILAAAKDKDYYEILGVERDATEREIDRAFHKLSLKYHPDKNPGDPVAAEKFVEVNEAHRVLQDEELRQIYDIDGIEGIEKDKQRKASGGAGSIFDLFGGGGGGRRKGPDFRMDFQVTLEQLYSGVTTNFNIKRNVICKRCRGTGAKEGATKKCPKCNGEGVTIGIQELGPGFKVQMQMTCDMCQGKGKIPKATCPVCGGKKVVMEEKTLEAVIERGMPDGYELVFPRASEQSPDTSPGDVIIVLRTLPHPRFQRNGNDLYTNMTISLREALLGFSKQITHLDGRQINVKVDTVTPPEFVKVITGEGMPHHQFPSDKGDLYVKFSVDFPKKLTQAQKDEIKKLLG